MRSMSPDATDKPGLAVCLSYHLPNISGLTLSAHEVAKDAVAHGHPATVISAHSPADTLPRESIDGVEIIRSPVWFRLGKAPVMPLYARDVWRALDGVGVVNIHLPNLDAAIAAIVAKLRGRRVIVSYISSMSKATLTDRIMRAAASLSHLVAGVLADRVQVVSEDYAEASTFCRLFRSKLVPAPLPISLRLFDGETLPARPAAGVAEKQPLKLGYVGRIARQKSLDVLLKALPLLEGRLDRPLQVDLVGPAEQVIGETYWRDILDAAAASGGTVRHLGVLTGRPLAEFYSNLDVLVLPSVDRLESFGLVQVEAMLRGVPVVASDLPGMRVPVARTGMGRLFRAGDSAELAECLADVLTNGPPRSLTPDELDALFGHDVACAPYRTLLSETKRQGQRA